MGYLAEIDAYTETAQLHQAYAGLPPYREEYVYSYQGLTARQRRWLREHNWFYAARRAHDGQVYRGWWRAWRVV